MLCNSCVSLQKVPSIDFFTLFNENSDIYIYAPIKDNKVLLTEFLEKTLILENSQKKEKLIQQFFDRAQEIYIASTFADQQTNSFEGIIKGNFPYLTPSFAFTEKNGFSKIKIDYCDGNTYTFWNNDISDIQVAFPYSGFILATTKSVVTMQEKLLKNETLSTSTITKKLDIEQNSSVIKLFIPSPGKLIPQILGANAIELAIKDAIIVLAPIKNNSMVYNMSIKLEMPSKQSQTVGLILLQLIANTKHFTFKKIDENNILISDYFISVKDITKILN